MPRININNAVSVMSLLLPLWMRSNQMTVFLIQVFKQICSQFCICHVLSSGRQTDALKSLYAFSPSCEKRLLTPLCLSVSPPGTNWIRWKDFREILYWGGGGGAWWWLLTLSRKFGFI
jgi:hypothetical protein